MNFIEAENGTRDETGNGNIIILENVCGTCIRKFFLNNISLKIKLFKTN